MIVDVQLRNGITMRFRTRGQLRAALSHAPDPAHEEQNTWCLMRERRQADGEEQPWKVVRLRSLRAPVIDYVLDVRDEPGVEESIALLNAAWVERQARKEQEHAAAAEPVA